MGRNPLMTPQGTFVINGAERVVVSAVAPFARASALRVRCTSWQSAFSFRIIPTAVRGSKCSSIRTTCSTSTSTAASAAASFLATTFLRALGYGTDADIINLFYTVEEAQAQRNLEEEEIATQGAQFRDVRDGESPWRALFEPLTRGTIRQILNARREGCAGRRHQADDTIIKALKKDPAPDEEEA